MGAAGYISKHSAPDVLTTAILQIRQHGSYHTPQVARLMAAELSGTATIRKPASHVILSNREMEVASMIASGTPMKQISLQLGLSIKTVSTHRARLLRKLELANNAELAAYFIRNGLLQ